MNDLNNSERFRKTAIVSYSSQWPLLYVDESKKISALIRDGLIAIHHIGSTSVPGMAAKPVIDILVIVKNIDQLDKHKVDLAKLGYSWIGEGSIPGRRYLWKHDNKVDFHLQCFQHDHIGSKNTLIFRDFLIAHPNKAMQYVKEKEKASKKFPNDTHAYADEKNHFVDSLLKEAINWHENKLVNDLIFKPIDIAHPALPNVIAPSIGMVTEQKIQPILSEYNISNRHLIGAFSGDRLIGVIGVEMTDEICAIKHISVPDENRMQGIGKKLILYIAHHFPNKHLIAETDEDSVGFYRKCGFQCKSFESQYGKRYRCEY